MSVQLTLALRYLNGRKLRTALTTLAIVFGVLVIFGMNTLLPAFRRAFQVNVLAAAGQVDATVTLKTSDAFDASVVGKVSAVQGVRAASGSLNRTVNVPSDYYDHDPAMPDAVNALSLVGIDPAQAMTVHTYPIKEGRFLKEDDANVAVISASLAEALGVRLGGTFNLPTANGETTLKVIGILPARALPGNEEVLVTLPQAQAMLAMPDKINTIEVNYDTLDKVRRAEIERAILSMLGDAYQIGSLASNSELLTNLSIAQAIFSLLGVLALLMGGFIIFNTFRTIVAERRRDIGMLRALGANRATIFGVILSEGLVQGLIGTALGLVLGYLLGAGMISLLSSLLMQFVHAKIGAPVVSPLLIIGSIVMGVGVTLLAGLLPAVSASRVTPLEALRPSVGAVSFKRMAGFGFWSGAAMIALAVAALITRNVGLIGLGSILFILGLILVAPALVNPLANLLGTLAKALFARGSTAQLAEGNLSRQPTRAAITASTTLIGMAILVMAASVISSVQIGFGRVMRKSLGSDYLVIPPSVALWGTNVGAGEDLAKKLRAVDGVALVSTLRFAPSRINGMAVSMLGIDPATYPQVSGLTFSAGDEATAYAALGQGRNVILNPVLASSVGAKVGDEIQLLTPTGYQAYRVAGIAGDYLNAKIATAYISHANLAMDFNRHEDVLLQINLVPRANREAVEGALKKTMKCSVANMDKV